MFNLFRMVRLCGKGVDREIRRDGLPTHVIDDDGDSETMVW